jgi:DHA2 family multidrug resistance protein-like MFS transporter
MILMGTGIALTWAPTTESIMGSLPPAKAGIGSAVNDAVREVGGALGVAILGSILASQYATSIESTTAGLPDPAADAAGNSLGGTVVVAGQVGGRAGAALLEAAQAAYVDGFRLALFVAAAVAFAGAAVAAIWLPARANVVDTSDVEIPADADTQLVAA